MTFCVYAAYPAELGIGPSPKHQTEQSGKPAQYVSLSCLFWRIPCGLLSGFAIKPKDVDAA